MGLLEDKCKIIKHEKFNKLRETVNRLSYKVNIVAAADLVTRKFTTALT